MTDVLVIGAGISGLSLAYFLQQAGIGVQVLEAGSDIGGVIRSERREDCLLEWGPNSLLCRTAGTEQFLQSLNLSEQLQEADRNAARRFIGLSPKGPADVDSAGQIRLAKLPSSPGEFLRSDILPLSAKLRLFAEPLAPHRSADDESVRDFFSRRFGSVCTDRLVSAGMNGVWAGDIGRLSVRSTLPLLWDFERRGQSTLFGLLGTARKKNAKSTCPAMDSSQPPEQRIPRRLLSFRDGISVLPRTLVARLQPGSLVLNTAVERLEQHSGSITAHAGSSAFHAHVVCLTADTEVSAQLLAPFDAELKDRIRSLSYAPIGILHLAFQQQQLPTAPVGFGFLVPASHPSGVLGAIFSSSIFSGRAPADVHLLTCFCGGATKPAAAEVNDSDIRKRLIADVSTALSAKGSPDVVSAAVLPRAIPNYCLGHHQLQERIKTFTASHPRVRLCANWLDGVSLPERIERARSLAAELPAILARLR
jgi:oxygen-dependent protoporphyrinogen oxidase